MGNEAVPLNYIPIAIFAVVGAIFGGVSLIAGYFVRPSNPYRAKLLPYESGSPLFSDARVQFPMRYYVIAMLFVKRGEPELTQEQQAELEKAKTDAK